MTWIESHIALGRHPKTRRLSRALDVSMPAAVGHLTYFWWWAMDYAPDGDLSEFDAADIADGSLWDGDADAFLAALRAAGFIDGDQIHDWEEYGGKLHRRRTSDAERKRVLRTSTGRPADGAPTAYVEKSREEESREEESREEEIDGDGAPDPTDPEFRDKYGTILVALGVQSPDRRLADEIAQLAEDETLDVLVAAIAGCRRDNVRPWPRELRKRIRPPIVASLEERRRRFAT